MSTKHFHLTGVSAAGNNVPSRREFSDFAKDEDVVNMYLLALNRIVEAKQTELTSFFQIAGIHGLPYIPWDNVQGLAQPTFGGYCTHGSVIFPTWHRPYVALIEQIIWDQASKIANSYENPALKNKYQDAVKRLRQPYFDWAANATLHPLLSTAETVSVVDAPKGNTKQIRNPLVSYLFHPIDPSFPAPFSKWPQTMRHATNDTAKAESQPNQVQRAMNRSSDQLRDNTFDLLAYNHDWASFSNHTTSGNSLESIHDQVHVLIGGNGHMSSVPVAGFDLIFFLHHCNVDRLLALWQALNPDLWVTSGDSGDGSFTLSSGQIIDANSNLTPFHIDDFQFWTSANSRDTKAFGYAYPETNFPNATPDELKARVTQAVMELYGPRFDASQALGSASAASEPVAQKSFVAAHVSSNTGHANPAHAHAPAPDPASIPQRPSRYHDWCVIVTVNPYEFSSSGYVHIFLADTVPSSDNWLFADERVGDVGIFRNTSGRCENCNIREEAGEKIVGHVPLTQALIRKGKDINDVEGVKEYLKTHLHWRCALIDSSKVPLEKVPSLEVKVFSAECEKAETRDGIEGFPRRHGSHVHHSVTHGKLGGFSITSD